MAKKIKYKMKFFDIILFNIYTFLNFVNSGVLQRDHYEAKLHSYIVASGTIALNIFTILSLSFYFILEKPMPKYVFYISTCLILLIFYLIYLKNKRFEKVLSYYENRKISLFNIILTLLYISITFYLMLITGDFIRSSNGF
jgi:hypothetical protein